MKSLNILMLTGKDFEIDEKYLEDIKSIASDADASLVEHKNVTLDMIKEADIVFGRIDPGYLKHAENLKWFQITAAGADRYCDKSLYCKDDVILINSSGTYGMPIAEHVLGMILSFNRNLHLYAIHKNNRKWIKERKLRDFYGSTIGIIGLGDIGSALAKRSKAMGARVLAVKRVPGDMPEYVDELLYGQDGIDKLLKESDNVVIALPDTKSTKGIISEERLRMMKPDAFLVNIGRGTLIDQDALIKALKEGWIAGAGLDVTTPEPLPEDSPLWELPNLILSPHTSGTSPSNMVRRLDIFKENLRRYLRGDKLINVVDFETGY